jgi:amino acid transporter
MTSNNKQQISLLALVALLFCQVSGGPIGLEEIVSNSGIAASLILIITVPFFWAAPSALITAELCSAIPKEGGYYNWVKQGIGPKAGYLSAMWMWIYSWFDCAIYPVLFADILITFLNSIGIINVSEEQMIFYRLACAIVVIVPITILNLSGIKKVGKWSIVFTYIILIPFLILIILGLKKLFTESSIIPNLFTDTNNNLDFSTALSSGLLIVMWNYLGWSALSTISNEVKDPQKTFPKALYFSMILVTGCYFFAVLFGFILYPYPDKWTSGVWSEIGFVSGGTWLQILIVIASLFSAVSLFNAQALAASRIPYVLAKDSLLPNFFAKLSDKTNVPTNSIIFCSIIYFLLCSFSFTELLVLDVLLFSGTKLFQHISFIKLRINEPNLVRPFKVPGNIFILSLLAFLPLLLPAYAIYDAIAQQEQNISIIIATAVFITTTVSALFVVKKPANFDQTN